MRLSSPVFALGLLAAPSLVVCGCSTISGGQQMQTSPAAGQTGKFVHCVFFTCKPDTPDSEIDNLVADADRLLSKIPSVRRIESGRRDLRMDRDVNAKDYTVGLVVHFDDKAGHDLYNDHPTHKEYIEKHKAHWAGVRVYDFLAR